MPLPAPGVQEKQRRAGAALGIEVLCTEEETETGPTQPAQKGPEGSYKRGPTY